MHPQNIMIAIMARSFEKVNNDQGLRFLSSRAQIIDELESTLPRWLIPKGAYPPFVHILKVWVAVLGLRAGDDVALSSDEAELC